MRGCKISVVMAEKSAPRAPSYGHGDYNNLGLTMGVQSQWTSQFHEAPPRSSYHEITTFNISLVVHGTIVENMDFTEDDSNPYAVPIAMGIYRRLESPLDITTSTIIRRIVANHEGYQCKQGWLTQEEDAHLLSDETSCSLLWPD